MYKKDEFPDGEKIIHFIHPASLYTFKRTKCIKCIKNIHQERTEDMEADSKYQREDGDHFPLVIRFG